MMNNSNLQMSVRDVWCKMLAPKIYEQCSREKGSNSRLREQLENFTTCDKG